MGGRVSANSAKFVVKRLRDRLSSRLKTSDPDADLDLVRGAVSVSLVMLHAPLITGDFLEVDQLADVFRQDEA